MKTYSALGGVLVPLVAGLAAACSSNNTATDTAPLSVAELQDPSTCNQCHQDHYTEWQQSMHAYASTDPLFRAMNARGQKETNGALGSFCVKCHAPMAVALNMTTDGSNLDSLPEKFQGITCYFCHNVTEVDGTHNNPLVLANDQTMRGGILDPLKYKGHNAEYSQLFDDDATAASFKSSSLCGSCHDIVVPNHFSGAMADVPLERTFTEWQSSVFADPNSNVKLNCTSGGGCHMDRVLRVPIANPPEPHPIMPTRTARHVHNFPAIDVALTGDQMTRDAELAAVKDKLATEFRIEICADPPNGVSGVIAVTIENLSAGHNYPSGSSQDRRTWVEVHAIKNGMEQKAFGVVAPNQSALDVPGTWVLYDKTTKVDGTPAHMFWDIANIDSTGTLPVSTTAMLNGNLLTKQFQGALEPDRVTVTIWVEAVGLDVINDMVQSGNLDPSMVGAIQRIPVALAGQQPAPVGTTPVTFDWDAATSVDATMGGYFKNNQSCLETAPSRFAAPPPQTMQ